MLHIASLLCILFALAQSALAASKRPFVSTYWPSYHAALQPPSKIPYHLLTNIDWFVAAPTKDGKLVQADSGPTFEPLNTKEIKDVIARAHKNKVTVTMSIGGWTGSRYFSSLVKSADSRSKFAATLAKARKQYGFDALSIDWEPGTQGTGCNQVDEANDIENYILFLQELRCKVGKRVRISSAVPAAGYAAFKDGQSKRLAAALTDILIMTYDFNGPTWAPVTAPNAPVQGCKASVSPYYVDNSIDLWLEYGFKESQLILGMPSYGYGYRNVKKLQKNKNDDGTPTLLYNTYSGSVGGATSDSGKDICGVQQANGGQWLYQELITGKFLDSSGRKGVNGWTRYYDACTETPFLYSPRKQVLIAYDDVQSITVKATLARRKRLAGIAFFDSTGDYRNVLLNAARKAIGA